MRLLFPRLLILLMPSLADAAGSLTVGGGLNVTSTNNDGFFQPPSPPNPPGYVPDPESRTGYNLGIGYEYEMASWLSLGAEANIETRGENATVTHPNPSLPVVEVEIRLLYVQVPVFATLKRSLGPVTLGVFGGPSLGRMIQAERERRVNGTPQPVAKADANRTDLGLEMGGTLEWNLRLGALFLRPGYYWGLLDFSEDPPAKHRVAKLRLGYKFPL